MKGSTRKRGRTWTAYWWAKDPATGKLKQHSKGGFRVKRGNKDTGEVGAEDHLNTVKPQVDAGTWRPEKPVRVSELLLEHYLPARESEGLRPATLAQYRRAAEAWLIPHIGGLEVLQLTPKMVNDVADKLRAQGSTQGRGGLSPRSVQVAITTLKAATAWGAGTDLLARDPLAGLRRPRAKPSSVGQAWSVEEARAFLAAVADDRLAAAWKLLLTRGPRRGELGGLRWDSVDLDRGGIQITTTRIVVDGRAVDSTPKTDAGKRWLPLDEELIASLRAHRRHQLEERIAAGPAYEESGYVFTDELGRPYHPEYFSTRFESLVRQSGARRLRLHDCRHTACSVMLLAGEPPFIVAKILGHSSTRMVEEVYRHLMGDELERAGEAASRMLLSE